LLIALFFLLVSFGLYSIIFSGKIYARATVAGINVGLKSKGEATVILKQKTDEFLKMPIVLNLSDSEKSYNINLAEIGLNFDIDAVVDSAWAYGRREKAWNSFKEQFRSIFVKNVIPVRCTYNDENLNRKLEDISAELDQPEKDFSFLYTDGRFSLSGDRKSGVRIDRGQIKAAILAEINDLHHSPVSFKINEYKPTVTEEKAKSRLLEANKILEAGELVLKDGGQEYEIDIDTIGGFIKTKTNDDDLEIIFNEDRLKVYVESIAKSINVDPINAKLAVSDNRATIFQPSKDGKTLDQERTKGDIKNKLLSRISGQGDSKTLELVINIKKPEVSDGDVNNLGIKELIATAMTNFIGSSSNRIHNIQTGANVLNGILLKPGDTFSTLGHLGTIDGSTGYLPELVIKEDRTTPEFGGGLCQVSSTLFRATLQAGMKIIERQNHKYRVSYYEPPVGMDATIYDPAPDFRFINNYNSHVLIQSKVEGTKITFDLYGTKDDRKVEVGTPIVYDYVDPDPPVEVETDTLPPGERKLVEKAHQGASAKFNYKVTRGEEVLQEKTFLSKYVPWQEKWLVGKVNTPHCSDGLQNGEETGVDCGGSCTSCTAL